MKNEFRHGSAPVTMRPQESGTKMMRQDFGHQEFRAIYKASDKQGLSGMATLFSSFSKLTFAAGLLAAVAGCTSIGAVKPLSFGPVSAPKIGGSDAILVSLNGGILPKEAVNSLSKPDQLRALAAEYQALEKAPLGQTVAWKGQTSNASGEISVGTPYQVGRQNCRQYTHTATIKGAPVKGQGAACRNEDGSWTPLS